MRISQVAITTALVLIMMPATSFAQNKNIFHSNASLAEKVYLQLDGNVYTTGNTIWFKCILTNAYNHAPSLLSGVLYAELITPDETIHEKKLIKIENGIGQGFFYLDKKMSEGLYLIRAYTEWNKNFGTDFLFKEYIQVFAPEKEKVMPISNINLIKNQNNEQRLEACFNPSAIDSLHKNKLTVFITLDNKKDTLVVKKGKDNKYWIDYSIANKSQFATLQMQTANQRKFSKTVVLHEDYIDLQFFPESGELIHGLPGKLGFKALNANGKGLRIQGDIINEQDSVILSFESNFLGMGSFMLSRIDSTISYFARLRSQSDENQQILFPLPKISPLGNVLSISKGSDNIQLAAMSNYLNDDSIYLEVSCRGINYYKMKVALEDGLFKCLFPGFKLPEGIISFRMLNDLMQPVAERLYFNERPETRLNITLETDTGIYKKREPTSLKIKTTNSEGEDIKANLSVLVMNKRQLGKMQRTRQNILSYFLLNSELKGEIEDPGFYFNKDSSSHYSLDALMLTQGWRKYHYRRPLEKISYKWEPKLSVCGHVSGVFSKNKRISEGHIQMTYDENELMYSQTTDSLGRFGFYLDDEFGKNIDVTLQSLNKSGRKQDYTISIDIKESPPINFNHVNSIGKIDSVVYEFVEKDIERDLMDEAFPLSSDNIFIEEVTVTSYVLTPARKKVTERHGKPTEVIDGEEIIAKEYKLNYGLYSVLLQSFSDKIIIKRKPNGELYAKVIGSDLTLVIIDGIPVKHYDYTYIPGIPTSEVTSFEIIECADKWCELYIEAVGGGQCPPIVACCGVIAIYTHDENGLYGIQTPVGLKRVSVPVFSEPREFYAPKYSNNQDVDWYKPDLRALIHWEPILRTDSTGNAELSFYNADNIGEMLVVVEAISETGEIGYQEIVYEIEGKEQEIIIVK